MSWALVAGAGPGLGAALLQRFERGGLRAIGLSRSGGQIGHLALAGVDLSDPGALGPILETLIAANGPPQIVVHNPARLQISAPIDTTTQDFEARWRDMALSAFNLAQGTLPAMARHGHGTFIVSGATASLRGGANFSAFASAKFALRGLTQSLARTYQPQGVHIAHVILDGIVDSAASRALHGLQQSRMIHPDDIAELYWQLASQPRSAWTHELDLRPYGEAF
jgi:NAD(P)-dependent dehydrogenase (short-subunit alcohol dehydrogenase family)